jgi:hypothetical protein
MRLLSAFSNCFLLVAVGVSRLKSSWQAAKSEPTHVGCYFWHGLLKGHLPRLFLWSAWPAALALLCGCQTTTQSLFTASGPGWHIQQGQALWRPKQGMPEFGGDLVLAVNADGRALIQFDKTPLSMVFAQVTTNRWLIRFPQQQMGFSGHGLPPTRFAWLYLPAALDGEPLPLPLHFERKPDGNWRLENTRTGEIVEGYLSP